MLDIIKSPVVTCKPGVALAPVKGLRRIRFARKRSTRSQESSVKVLEAYVKAVLS